ncbi:desulfoferrodoxin FeS4 iron-binding domain-containing protein [Candidatus Bathyarchaeota archaeon]|nr:desulfoferrodoxin FeS4 iron-binding domain-containing protein [Candidatus Bathyarchaeota archaeon]
MAKVGETYLCKICGNKVEVVAAGAGQLVCCGQPMQLVKK